MSLISLRITDFRNLANIEFAPSISGINIISGDNGSGKTSLLEAIYYLGYGKSFRSSNSQRLIRHQQSKFSLSGQLVNDALRQFPVGFERDLLGNSRIRVDEKDAANISELISLLPIRLINSQSHQIFESGPAFRRKFLDWGLFYHSDRFLLVWRQFERVLKHRNVLLKAHCSRAEIAIWNDELVKYASELTDLREEYVASLKPYVLSLTKKLLDLDGLELEYLPGWDAKKTSFAEILVNSQIDDYRFGSTQHGPHRADLEVKVSKGLVRHFLSRGQQKMLICAMLVAQGMLLSERKNKALIYLIDDLPSELDLQSKNKLISLLTKQQAQIFITAIESEAICEALSGLEGVTKQVFHVEHGIIKAQ